ncbi:MAG: head-tail joining protein [Pseudomonadota bacterium]
MSILEGELASVIADALTEADIPVDVVLTRTTAGSGDPWNPSGGTTETFECRGFADAYRANERAGTLIAETDIKVVVIAATLLTEPTTGDVLTIGGKSYNVQSVLTDPAKALWECRCSA